MEHAHDQFYILTNYGQDKEFKVRAPVLCISYKTIFTTDNDSYRRESRYVGTLLYSW